MSDQVEIITSFCQNCGTLISRVPFQPDPIKLAYIWQWVHADRRQVCPVSFYATPRATDTRATDLPG